MGSDIHKDTMDTPHGMVSFPSTQLLAWFGEHQRDFPWRKTYDPYHVWISEVMAQQTRMDQLLPYYARFMQQFPTLHTLADADEQFVLKAWEGLGYYSRARNLHAAAKGVVKEFNGKIPSTREQLKRLKGVGPYISAAVASIAFNEDVPVVDGNVFRVATRFWGLQDDVSLPKTRDKLEKMLHEVLPHGKARDFNQAMMELGALVCTPDHPSCNSCPLQQGCFAFAHAQQDKFPVKTKKGKAPIKHFAMLVLEKEGKIALEQRKTKLLAGMWEFPMVEYAPLTDSPQMLEEKIGQKLGASIRLSKNIGQLTHQYSHFTQHVHVFEGHVSDSAPHAQFFSWSEVHQKPLSKIQLKALELLGKTR